MLILLYVVYSGEVEQRICDLLLICPLRRHSGDDHHIKSLFKTGLIEPVSFTDQAGKPVAHHTIPDLFADRNADTVLFQLIFSHIHDKKPVCG